MVFQCFGVCVFLKAVVVCVLPSCGLLVGVVWFVWCVGSIGMVVCDVEFTMYVCGGLVR